MNTAMAVQVKERPILFSGPMVRAILLNEKTQTRRVIKIPNPAGITGEAEFCRWSTALGQAQAIFTWGSVTNPYGIPGERLWVRETWRKWDNGGRQIAYAADHKCYEVEFSDGEPVSVWDDGFTIPADIKGYKPSIHMPRWACRLNLEILSIRVERIQDISLEDAKAEGRQCIAHFRQTWETLNGKRGFGWNDNPFVWVIDFKKLA